MNDEHSKTGVLSLTPEELKIFRESRKQIVDIADCLTRLESNNDFKKVFVEEYSKNRPARLTMLLGDNTVLYGTSENKYKQREDIIEELTSIARFDLYLRNIRNSAEQAKKELESLAEAEREYYNNKE